MSNFIVSHIFNLTKNVVIICVRKFGCVNIFLWCCLEIPVGYSIFYFYTDMTIAIVGIILKKSYKFLQIEVDTWNILSSINFL